MKLTVLISAVLILINSIAFCQKSIDGFYGIKFGTNKTEAMRIMKSKGAIVDAALSTDTRIAYSHLTFAKRESNLAAIYFINDKLFQGVVFIKPQNKQEVIEIFDQMVEEISEIYPKPTVYRNYKYPYKESDNMGTIPIESGHASFTAFWNTPVENNIDNYISLEITKDLQLKLLYQDGTLVKESAAKAKDEKSKDY